MRCVPAIICLLALWHGPLPGSQSRATMAEDHPRGLQFSVPVGWTHQQHEDGFTPTSEGRSAAILVLYHRLATLDELMNSAREGVDEDGIRLSLAGEITATTRTRVEGEFAGTMGGQEAGAYAMGLLAPSGGGVIILAIATPGEYGPEYRRLAGQIAASVRFTSHNAGKRVEQWSKTLRGNRLTCLSGYTSGSSGGYNAQRVITLCSSGTFTLYGTSSVSVYVPGSTGGSTDSEQSQGTWRVTAPMGEFVLELRLSDGAVQRYALNESGGRVLLNGVGYFLTRDAECN